MLKLRTAAIALLATFSLSIAAESVTPTHAEARRPGKVCIIGKVCKRWRGTQGFTEAPSTSTTEPGVPA